MASFTDSISLYRERGQVASVVKTFEGATDRLNRLPARQRWTIYLAYLEACLEYKPESLSPEILQQAQELLPNPGHNEVQILYALEGIMLLRSGRASAVSDKILPYIDNSSCDLEAQIWLHCLMVSYCLQVYATEEALLHIEALLPHLSETPAVMRFSVLLAHAEIRLLAPASCDHASAPCLQKLQTSAAASLPADLEVAYQCRVTEMQSLLGRNTQALCNCAQASVASLQQLEYHYCARQSALLHSLFSNSDDIPTGEDSRRLSVIASTASQSGCTGLRPLVAYQALRLGYADDLWQRWDSSRQKEFLDILHSVLNINDGGVELYAIGAGLRQSNQVSEDAQYNSDAGKSADLPPTLGWGELDWIRGEVKDMLTSMSLSYQALQAGQLDEQHQHHADRVDAMVANIRAQAFRQFLYFGRPNAKPAANISTFKFAALLDQALRRITLLWPREVTFTTDVASWPILKINLDRRMAEPIAFIMAELAGSLARSSWPEQAVSVRLCASENAKLAHRVIEIVIETDSHREVSLSPEALFESKQIVVRCIALATMLEANESQFSWRTELFRVALRIELLQSNVVP